MGPTDLANELNKDFLDDVAAAVAAVAVAAVAAAVAAAVVAAVDKKRVVVGGKFVAGKVAAAAERVTAVPLLGLGLGGLAEEDEHTY